MKSPAAVSIKTNLEMCFFAAFVLACVFLFDFQRPLTNFIFIFLCAAAYLLYFKNMPPDKKNAAYSKPLLYISFIFIALKFYKLFSFPPDFFGDEFISVIAPYNLLNGNDGPFDYNTRYGISLPVIVNLVTALVMKLTGPNLDLLRFIPVLAFCATAYGFWKLAVAVKMPKSAAAFVFVYALSEWAWKLSKLYLPNFYIPLFIVFFLLMFFSSVNTGSLLQLAAAGLLFACGFFTYGVWPLMVPFVIYLAIEYHKELGWKKLTGFLLFVIFFTTAAFFIYHSSRHITEGMAARTVFSGNTGIIDIIKGGLINLYKFFLASIDTDTSFISAPFFYAVEILLLVLGLMDMFLHIKIRENRVFLTGFIMSLSTILFTPDTAYPLRHNIAFTFAIIVCVKGFNVIAKKTRFLFVLVPVYVFSALAFMLVYYFIWGSLMPQTLIDRKISAFINSNYAGQNFLYINDTEPYGRYMAFLRTKAAYRDKHSLKFDYAVFTTPVLWHKSIQDALPEIEVKYFFEGSSEAALWMLPLAGRSETAAYLTNMSENLSAVDNLMWKENYDAALDLIMRKVSLSGGIYSVLQNTFLKVHESTVYAKKKNLYKLAKCIIDTPYPVLPITTDYYFAGVMFETRKQYRDAYRSYEKASQLAPGCLAPRAKMLLMKSLEGR